MSSNLLKSIKHFNHKIFFLWGVRNFNDEICRRKYWKFNHEIYFILRVRHFNDEVFQQIFFLKIKMLTNLRTQSRERGFNIRISRKISFEGIKIFNINISRKGIKKLLKSLKLLENWKKHLKMDKSASK